MATEQVRILRVQGRAEGMELVTSALDKVSGAAGRVAVAADGMTVAQTRTESRTLSLASAYDKFQSRLDLNHRVVQQVARDQQKLDQFRDSGLASLSRYNELTALNSAKLNDNVLASSKVTRAVGLSASQFQVLSFQVNDVLTGLASGQSPFMILAQQGGQVQQILSAGQGGIVGSLKSIGSAISAMATPARLLFGGIAAGAVTAALALNSYSSSQQRAAMAITGAGRASGASISSINATASAGSSPSGFSVSEARELATALAATGKVADQNILPIVRMGKDIATAFGTNATDAVEMLAKAFADPIAGADTLNARLGFMDAAIKTQIADLVAQNRLWEAQRVLTAGVAAGLADVSTATATSTKFWAALGNTASNAWDQIGAGLARATGIGLITGLDDQLKVAKRRLDDFRKVADQEAEYVSALRKSGVSEKEIGSIVPANAAAAEGIVKYTAEVDRLSEAMKRNAQATGDAQERQFSFAQSAAVRGQLPAINQTQKLRNDNDLLVRTMIDVQTSGGANSEILKRMGVSYDELGNAVAASGSKLKNFKTDFEQATASQATQMQSLTAFSPGAKGQIAFQERFNSEVARGTVETKAAALAAGDQAIAIKGVAVALSEASRARALSSDQSVQSAQLEVDLLGKSIGQQAEMRANLQARQQLEQAVAQYRIGVDEAEYGRLQKINAELGRRTQLAAQAATNDNIKFGAATSLLSQDDVSIAQQLKTIYPDVATALSSVEASGLHTNAALSGLSSSMSGSLVSGLSDIAGGTKSASAGFASLQTTVIRALTEMIIKMTVVIPLMRALQMGASALGGSFGSGSSAGTVPGAIGPTSLNGAPLVTSANGNAFSGGNVIPFANGGVVRRPTMFPMANGGTGIAGEVPGSEEGILPLTRIHGKLGVHAVGGGGGGTGPITVNVNNAPAGTTAEVSQTKNSDGSTSIDITLKKMVEAIGVESIASGDMGRAIGSKFGLKQFQGS
jgi:phage-related minor tail protein